MGCINGRMRSASTKSAITLSKSIDLELDSQRDSQVDIVKLLLLGTGESGKSTVFKQLRMLYGENFTEEERRRFLVFMRQNSIETMEKLCCALWKKDPQDPLCSTPAFNSICADPSLNASSKTFDSYHKYPPLTADKAEAIETLWKAKSIQEVWQNRSGLHLIDSAANFFERIRDIAKDDFLPSHFDILKTRIRTAGIREEYFSIQSKRVQIFDLGGQRSERRKWYNAIKNVHAIIFLAAISEYDQKMLEDPDCNRLEDSLSLFSTLINQPCFSETTFVVFFNKIDLFKEKIKHVDIASHWDDYTGRSGDVDEGITFFTNKYKRCVKPVMDNQNTRDVQYFVTCATDTELMKHIMESVEPVIINRALDSFGII